MQPNREIGCDVDARHTDGEQWFVFREDIRCGKGGETNGSDESANHAAE
jgi:hypothetical protein